MEKFIGFLKDLKRAAIYFELGYYSDDAVMVKVVVPGERWEVEFFENGDTAVEKFKVDGPVLWGETEIPKLFDKWSD